MELNPRVIQLLELIQSVAQPGQLYTGAFYHHPVCPALVDGASLQDCACHVELKLECYDVVPASPPEWWEKPKGQG